ncbi:MAG: AbrB/MazE/SpoVT family DNA-binding domain-containing protein [Burkholderiales bacterium]|jgi:AbrB family looped-hinge helix DNA binding protein
MTAVTVSDKGQVVIPAGIRKQLGITPGSRLDFRIEGQSIRAEIVRTVVPTKLEDGYGMLVCTSKGARTLADFDIAKAMRKARNDRG